MGWGGPLDAYWRETQMLLQQKILAASRSYGMINVLPGFSGNVTFSYLFLFVVS